MNTHPAFRHALIALSHPVSVAAIVIVLLNDHWWRRVAPSWFTGKIGDFAWLIFAPFLLAVLLAWLMPRREKLVGHVAIVGVGLIFGLAKSVPAFHALTIGVLEFLTGWPNILRLDPADLFALPALLLAWWIWEDSAARSVQLPNRGWVLLPLAVLATMADSPAPDFGICDFKIAGSDITTRQFTSQDGGLTWQGNSGGYGHFCQLRKSQWQLIDPTDEQIRYRFTPGVSVERSSDSGQSWSKELDLTGDDARVSYTGQTSQLFYSQPTGPIDAVIHQPTGNLVAAMGYEGALVRTPNGVWHWVAVGEYHVPDLTRVDNVVALLAGELLYALVLFALTLGTLARRVFIANPRRARMRQTLRIVLVGIAWLGWIMAVVLFPPAKASGYLGKNSAVMAAMAVALFAVPMMLGQVNALIRSNRRALRPTVLVAILISALYLLPYVVWSQGGIPFYTTAALYALVLVAMTLIAGRLYLRRFLDELSTQMNDTHVPTSP